MRLSQSHRDDLLAVQRMLLRLGIASTIYPIAATPGAAGTARRTRRGKSLYSDSGATRTGRRERQSDGVSGTRRLRGYEKAARLSGDLRLPPPLRTERLRRNVEASRRSRRSGGVRRRNSRHQCLRRQWLLGAQLRRAAAPSLRRLPAGLGQPGAVCRAAVHARGAARRRAARGNRARRRADGRRGWTWRWNRARRVRLLDVIDISGFPLPAQQEEARNKRRIGLGVTGLADALILCGLRYGSPEAVAATDAWLATIQRAAYLASAELAAEKGAFPLFDREKYLAGETVAGLDAGRARRDRQTRHPQRAPDLGGADRHDLAVGRQCFLRAGAGVQLPLHAQRADARRHPPRGGGHGLRLSPVPPAARRGRAAAGLFRRRADAVARGPRRDAGGGAAPHRQLDLEDDQRPGRHPVRAASRTSTRGPMRSAARDARHTGRTR